MRSSTVSQTGTGTSAWLPCDLNISPFNIGLGVVVTGSVTYTVEHTFDDPASSPTAFPHPVVAGQTANKDGNYAYAVRAVRVNVTAGTGTAKLTILQAGI